MSEVYSDGARELQDKYGTRHLADREVDVIMHDEITDDDRAFIESRDLFFIATVDGDGQPQCSYKGGDVGLLKVVDEKTIAFPCYDGNGMFLTMGNILNTAKVGILLIDFEDPRRFRINGTATLHEDDELLSEFHEAQFIVRVALDNMFINCPRYVHRFKKIEHSPFVPKAGSETPVPRWKTNDAIQDVFPDRDKARARAERAKRGLD